jgi:CheY-like chemotaxis protein
MNRADLEIDGVPFLNALIVDNRHDDIESLENDLKKRSISVIFAKTSTEAESIIKLKPEIDLVILDWFLNEEDGSEAKLLLNLLKIHAFAPIIIYTEQDKESPSYYLKQAHLDRVAIALNKSEVKGDIVFNEIKKWLAENPELKIFLMWSNEVKKRLNETLWAVHNLDIGGLRALIELLKTPEGLAQTTREQDLVDFFGEVLTRKLVLDESFLTSIGAVVEHLLALRQKVELDVDKLKAFHAFERYKPAGIESLWTGSILKDDSENYFVVVTPVCDFCNENKIERILLLEAEPLLKYGKDRSLSRGKMDPCIRNNKDIVHYLPYAPNLPEGLVCRFDKIVSKNVEELKKSLKEKKLKCVAILDSPFVENLIQRMNAYLMRLGVRDLDEREITKLLDSATAEEKTTNKAD